MDTNLIDFYRQFINPEDVVFDIGASVGQWTEVFSKLAKTVIAAEPQSGYANILKNKNLPNVTVVEKAVTDFIGKTILRCPINGPDTIASISDKFIDEVQISHRFGDVKFWYPREVETTTLDSLIQEYGVPAFIKIDVEGSEANVLKGLSRPVKALSFEFHPELMSVVRESFVHLKRLGKPFAVNYSIGQNPELQLDGWTHKLEDLDWHFKRFEGDYQTMGDIYVLW